MVLLAGPPPSVSTTAKLVKQSMKTMPATPGSTCRSSGHSIRRKTCREFMPSWVARRQVSPGMAPQTGSSSRVASGRLKKAWRDQDARQAVEELMRSHAQAGQEPIEQSGLPVDGDDAEDADQCRQDQRQAEQPQQQRAAGKLGRRASARATRMAGPTLSSVDSSACQTVKVTTRWVYRLSRKAP